MSTLTPLPSATSLVFPSQLVDGDTITVVSPAGSVRFDLFDPAEEMLRHEGWNVEEGTHARGKAGTYSASTENRLSDTCHAFTSPHTKAVLCGRGGYGAIHLLDALDSLPLASDPKWLIGFSDITALHALMLRHGIVSIHGSMLKALAEASRGRAEYQYASRCLFEILRGQYASYEFGPSPFNRQGQAIGTLVGGNLSVMTSLIGTRFDMLKPGAILFIEDINEPIYKIERMLWQLRLSGALHRLSGLVVGQFTGTLPDANYQTAYEMISDMTADCSYPIAFDAPIGHSNVNYPLLHGCTYSLTV